MRSDLSNNAEQFIPTKDHIETTEDGRTIQAAVKGVPIPRAEAARLGLLSDKPKTETEPKTDSKSKTPAENKSKAPAENK